MILPSSHPRESTFSFVVLRFLLSMARFGLRTALTPHCGNSDLKLFVGLFC